GEIAQVEIFVRRGIRRLLEQRRAHEIDESLKTFAVDGAVATNDALRKIFIHAGTRVFEWDAGAPADQLGGLFLVRVRPLHRANHRFQITDGESGVRLGPAAVDDEAVELE